jgi:hypothetical protein
MTTVTIFVGSDGDVTVLTKSGANSAIDFPTNLEELKKVVVRRVLLPLRPAAEFFEDPR